MSDTSTAVHRPPFAYFGGKTRLAPLIAAAMPSHEHYVEPFGGSLAVLLAKPRSRMETVNDLDGDLMTFWRVLRDQPDELAPNGAPVSGKPVAEAATVDDLIHQLATNQ